MRTKSTLASLATFALLAAAAGCGSGTEAPDAQADPTTSPATSPPATPTASDSADPSATPPDTEQAVITIDDFQFNGPDSVAPGSTVTVKNNDSAPHTATADDGSFDVVVEGSGATGTFTAPNKPGKYPYICKFHPDMTGTLVVK